MCMKIIHPAVNYYVISVDLTKNAHYWHLVLEPYMLAIIEFSLRVV